MSVVTANRGLYASVVGASGYSGAEIVKILLKHPYVSLSKIFAQSSNGQRIDSLYPHLRGATSLLLEEYDSSAVSDSDVVFLALPSGEAMSIVPELIANGKRVIDLSGDFRLQEPSIYEEFYHTTHIAPELLPSAVYGLPEVNADAITDAQLIANPGCYPTSVILPLLPLLTSNCISGESIVINSLSGVSGAGRKASVDLSFAEIDGSLKAYRVGNHQHIPEIRQSLESFGRQQVSFTFIPHLLPTTRGIYTTTVARMAVDVSESEVCQTIEAFYHSSPFVRFMGNQVPNMKHVIHSNFIDIGVSIDAKNRMISIFSTIDNLVKGAAGQAVQNMNIMYGFNECEGLV